MVINIVIVGSLGIVKKVNPGLLNSILFCKKVGFLGKMNFVKQKATTKSPNSNFEKLKSPYLMAIITMEEIPDAMVVNWDQIAIKNTYPC